MSDLLRLISAVACGLAAILIITVLGLQWPRPDFAYTVSVAWWFAGTTIVVAIYTLVQIATMIAIRHTGRGFWVDFITSCLPLVSLAVVFVWQVSDLAIAVPKELATNAALYKLWWWFLWVFWLVAVLVDIILIGLMFSHRRSARHEQEEERARQLAEAQREQALAQERQAHAQEVLGLNRDLDRLRRELRNAGRNRRPDPPPPPPDPAPPAPAGGGPAPAAGI